MFGRVLAIAGNTYRENVRARVLYGLLALALATTLYSLVVANMSLQHETRVVADLGAASISLYAVLVSIVLGATSLHRELELKTIFPILTRQLRRHEYLVGKFIGTLATVAAFCAIDGSVVLGILALQAKVAPSLVLGASASGLAALFVLVVLAKRGRVFVALPWSLVMLVVMALVARPAGQETQLVLAQIALTMAEVAIVTAIATFFASFSSPFLTAVFTFGLFLVGRSADTLANLPVRMFGSGPAKGFFWLSRVVPNLHLYVPPRALLLGKSRDVATWPYVGSAWLNAVFYAAVLLALACLVFRKRDFT